MSERPQKLPPSERDFEVYRLNVVEGASSRETAREVGLSQTRVLQISQRVFEFISTELPDSPGLTNEQRLRGARLVADERMGHLYYLSLDAWRKSQGMHSVARAAADGKATTITREYFGEPRYLQQALRVTLAQAKVYERGASGKKQPEPAPAAIPPVGDCSARATEQGEVAESSAEADVVTAEQATTYDDQSARRAEFFGRLADVSPPVQSAEANDFAATDDEPEPAATLPLHQPLNRKERQKRQRLLARVLARRGK